MYHFNIIYLTINSINFKKYIGKHETDDLNDGYIGSGKLLNKAIKKYGKENFTYRIVYIFDSPEGMWAKEVKLVNEKWIARKDTYNLAPGGRGGSGKMLKSEETKKKISKSSKGKPKSEEDNKKNSEAHLGKTATEETKKLMSKAHLGKTATEEAKKLMSKAKENKYNGENNPMYGTHYMWIHSSTENKRVKPEELQSYLNEGWIKGIKKF